MENKRDKSHTESLEASLSAPAEAAAYIAAVKELGDNAALLLALRHVTDAQDIARPRHPKSPSNRQ